MTETREEQVEPPAEPSGTAGRPASDRTKARRFVGSTPFLILVALGVAILVKSFLVQAFYIPSESMVPTLEVGDRVFVNKLAYDLGEIGRGDVIVFESPHPGQVPDRGVVGGFLHWLGEGIGVAQPENEDFIKRVIALPGETIEIRDNVVYIDGQTLDEPYLPDGTTTVNLPSTKIAAGHLFMMGDNRTASRDSRYFGTIAKSAVIGRVFVRIWPPKSIGLL